MQVVVAAADCRSASAVSKSGGLQSPLFAGYGILIPGIIWAEGTKYYESR